MKKLLAIVMVVAMMFSMSVVAMADEAAYTVSAVAERNEDGTTTVYLSAKGNVQAYGVEIACTDATPILEYVEGLEGDPESIEYATDDFMAIVSMNVANVVDGTVILTGAATNAKAKNYDGSFATITFEGIVETSSITINNTVTGAVSEPISLNLPMPTPTPAPATPTPAPATPTPAPATAKPAPTADGDDKDVVDNKDDVDTDDKGKTEAPKTADVAPVATMITLVVVAGLAVVALKKKATN